MSLDPGMQKLVLMIVGIVCVTIIECFALYKGVDGQMLIIVTNIIAAIAGAAVGGIYKDKKVAQ